MKKDLIFVGAGSSNIFAILHLIKNRRDLLKDYNIQIIEKGKDTLNRESSEIISGMLGAGMMSDLKFVFTDIESHNINRYLGETSTKKYYKIIQDIIEDIHPEKHTINITKPTEFNSEVREGWGKLSIAQSTTWHIGSKYGRDLGVRIEEIFRKEGIILNFETELLEVDKLNRKIRVKSNSKERLIKFDKLFIGLGRSGSKFIKNILEDFNIHYPEIKEGSGSLNSNLRWRSFYNKDILLIGDSTPFLHDGGTRGIVPAGVSGIDSIEILFNYNRSALIDKYVLENNIGKIEKEIIKCYFEGYTYEYILELFSLLIKKFNKENIFDKDAKINNIIPKHYIDNKYEPIEFIKDMNLNFCEGNIIKYLSRSKQDKLADVKKALFYYEYQIKGNYNNIEKIIKDFNE